MKTALTCLALICATASAEDCRTFSERTLYPVAAKKAYRKPVVKPGKPHAVKRVKHRKPAPTLAKVIRTVSTYDCTPPSAPGAVPGSPFAQRMYYGARPEVSPFAAIPYFPGSKDYIPPFAYFPSAGTPLDGIAPQFYLTPSPDVTPQAEVPEPSILSLYAMGFGMLCCAKRRKP